MIQQGDIKGTFKETNLIRMGKCKTALIKGIGRNIHCEIIRNGAQYSAKDLGSVNVSYLNGKKLATSGSMI
ncbi:FHA domain-containing protein [Ferviditalea candida]|uniref:FHA domain-containing protein n=1 Tax=Ferviditalea candida TaxID=3108399 RepID=A0ABU5ZGF4_9BACL|nr:FHA domain-containing protein [Paenibacillaceae bacterium T2]